VKDTPIYAQCLTTIICLRHLAMFCSNFFVDLEYYLIQEICLISHTENPVLNDLNFERLFIKMFNPFTYEYAL
jgi:hypothetical protein